MSSIYHTPVLLQSVIGYLNIKKGEKYIDATLGGGGHGIEIVRKGGKVLGIDVDEESVGYVGRKWKVETGSWKLVRGNFKDLGEIARSNGFKKVSGIIFDLGVSSHQLETEERGFSFQKDAPLDMRMNSSADEQAVTAADLINGLTRKELYELFTKLGEEQFAGPISDSIIGARQIKPIATTGQLAKAVGDVYKKYHMKRGKINPATKVFQALRMAVNDELNNLRQALPQALDLLLPGGLPWRIELLKILPKNSRHWS
ncbi:16S rRNA (cytosine(1402)-N(4))-methyltransferase RsmH [Candidatus Microgenomates bacterium]|nr:16S rRNA (cytosine(1402)-N(4))-methyltransferase RsmH [Candidatus Microgenomates bacterium]